MQRMGSLCSQEFKQSRLSLISLLWFAPWHVPTQHRSFPKLNVMSATSSSPFIPRIAVTLVSLSHAIRCLQAAHVPMQVPADGAERKRILLIVWDKSTWVWFFPFPQIPPCCSHSVWHSCTFTSLRIFSLLLHPPPPQVPEMDLLSPKHCQVTENCLPSYPQHPTAISRSNCRIWAARGKWEPAWTF